MIHDKVLVHGTGGKKWIDRWIPENDEDIASLNANLDKIAGPQAPRNVFGFKNSKNRAKFEKKGPPVEKQPGPHRFAAALVELPRDLASRAQTLGMLIDDEALGDLGREIEPHVTVLYGLGEQSGAKLRAATQDVGPVGFDLGEIVAFKGVEEGTQDAVVVEIQNQGDLAKLHKALLDLPHDAIARASFRPHVTIAYTKPGLGERWAEELNQQAGALHGQHVEAAAFVYSSRAGTQMVIPLR